MRLQPAPFAEKWRFWRGEGEKPATGGNCASIRSAVGEDEKGQKGSIWSDRVRRMVGVLRRLTDCKCKDRVPVAEMVPLDRLCGARDEAREMQETLASVLGSAEAVEPCESKVIHTSTPVYSELTGGSVGVAGKGQ